VKSLIKKKDFRTYKRRPVSQRSGYKASGEKSGGECIILNAEAYDTTHKNESFIFYRNELNLEELFKSNIGILAFGGYIFSKSSGEVSFKLEYQMGGYDFSFEPPLSQKLKPMDWSPIGFHKEFSLDLDKKLKNIKLIMNITSDIDNTLQFISFDFDVINNNYYKEKYLKDHFYTKTSMYIPQIYYLKTTLPFTTYLINNDKKFYAGKLVVLKSCNRCTRYLPINIDNEIETLGFSLHCKKKAPCTHSNFNYYKIDNIEDIDNSMLIKSNIFIENNKVITYYGHQLECKSCKKFFVNAPLNPRRSPQQFKEDSLRRRAIEILVNYLLDKELIHHEFRKRTKKEFAEYIWNKFDRKCFKCKRKLSLDEMHLDHTMPLAYLYRLDETATCLCATDNSSKGDKFPVDFYDPEELAELQKITGLSKEVLYSRSVNSKVVSLLKENVVWFFDEFLNDPEYQKIRDGRLTADKILEAINKATGNSINFVDIYHSKTGEYPVTVTIK